MKNEHERGMDRIFDNINAQVDIIAPIIGAGGIAVVVNDLTGAAIEFARHLGWDGSALAYRMSANGRRTLFEGSNSNADHVTASWVASKRSGRILYIEGTGSTLLVNRDVGSGSYSLEPGSTDAARATA